MSAFINRTQMSNQARWTVSLLPLINRSLCLSFKFFIVFVLYRIKLQMSTFYIDGDFIFFLGSFINTSDSIICVLKIHNDDTFQSV